MLIYSKFTQCTHWFTKTLPKLMFLMFPTLVYGRLISLIDDALIWSACTKVGVVSMYYSGCGQLTLT